MKKLLCALIFLLAAPALKASDAVHTWRSILDGNELMREYKQSGHNSPESFLQTKGYKLMQNFPKEERQIWSTKLPTPQRAEVVVFIDPNGNCAYCEGYHINPTTGVRSPLWPWDFVPYFDAKQKKLLNPTKVAQNSTIPGKIRTLNEFWVKQAGYRHINTIHGPLGQMQLLYVRELIWSHRAVLVRYQNGQCTELRPVYAQDYITHTP